MHIDSHKGNQKFTRVNSQGRKSLTIEYQNVFKVFNSNVIRFLILSNLTIDSVLQVKNFPSSFFYLI